MYPLVQSSVLPAGAEKLTYCWHLLASWGVSEAINVPFFEGTAWAKLLESGGMVQWYQEGSWPVNYNKNAVCVVVWCSGTRRTPDLSIITRDSMCCGMVQWYQEGSWPVNYNKRCSMWYMVLWYHPSDPSGGTSCFICLAVKINQNSCWIPCVPWWVVKIMTGFRWRSQEGLQDPNI